MTALDDLLASPPSGAHPALVIDHLPFGEKTMLRAPLPYTDAPAAAAYYGKAQGMLTSDGTYVDLGAAYATLLQDSPDKREAMAAKSRTGFALRTMLADEELATHCQRLLKATEHTSRAPFILRVPSPLVWLAQAASAAGNDDRGSITSDHGESAAMYVADWLRRFVDFRVAALVLDTRRDETVGELPEENDEAFQPIVNAADHYGWGVLVQESEQVRQLGGDRTGATLPSGYWLGEGEVPDADFLLTTIPGEATPETVLEKLAAIRGS